MKKALKITGIVLGGSLILLLLCGLGGYLLPADVELGTEARLDASPEAVFEVLNSFDGQVTWWTKAMEAYDDLPPMDIVHSGGPASGAGMEIDFASGEEMFEEWRVLESEPPSRIVYEVDFQMFVVERTLVLEPDGDGTHITWTENGTFDNPVMRYMTLMPTDEVIGNFDRALVALNEVTAPQ